MTQSSCKRDTKSKIHPGMKLAPVYVFLYKYPLSRTVEEALAHDKRDPWGRDWELK